MNFDVVIIGAGVSGLAAAKELCANGFSVCLVEARNRIGGKIHTVRHDGVSVPLELGAEFIHANPKFTNEIIKKHRLRVDTIYGERLLQSSEGKLEKGDYWSKMSPVFKELSILEEDMSFKTFLDRNEGKFSEETERIFTQFVEGFNAAPSGDLSALMLGEEYNEAGEDSYVNHRLLDGYETIPKALFSDIAQENCTLLLNHIVTRVSWKKDEVTIEGKVDSKPFSVQATKIIVTVSPSILTSQSIRFLPDIPLKRETASQIGMGTVIKIVVIFNDGYWKLDERLGNTAFMHTIREQVPTWWTLKPLEAPVLVGWISGSATEKFQGFSSGEMQQMVVECLRDIFDRSESQIREIVRDIIVVDWQKDPFALGAYSYQKVGHPMARTYLGEPIEETLFFAGEATDNIVDTATVESAIASGYRAAKEIVDSVGSHSYATADAEKMN